MAVCAATAGPTGAQHGIKTRPQHSCTDKGIIGLDSCSCCEHLTGTYARKRGSTTLVLECRQVPLRPDHAKRTRAPFSLRVVHRPGCRLGSPLQLRTHAPVHGVYDTAKMKSPYSHIGRNDSPAYGLDKSPSCRPIVQSISPAARRQGQTLGDAPATACRQAPAETRHIMNRRLVTFYICRGSDETIHCNRNVYPYLPPFCAPSKLNRAIIHQAPKLVRHVALLVVRDATTLPTLRPRLLLLVHLARRYGRLRRLTLRQKLRRE